MHHDRIGMTCLLVARVITRGAIENLRGAESGSRRLKTWRAMMVGEDAHNNQGNDAPMRQARSRMINARSKVADTIATVRLLCSTGSVVPVLQRYHSRAWPFHFLWWRAEGEGR
jgi:hypothetical protein